MSAMNAMSIAEMLRTSVTPCEAPVAAASMTFALVFSIFIFTVPIVTGVSVSGRRILAMTMVAGAAMTDAVMRYFRGAPIVDVREQDGSRDVRHSPRHHRQELGLRHRGDVRGDR